MGSCQSNSAVDERKGEIDAINNKLDEQYLTKENDGIGNINKDNNETKNGANDDRTIRSQGTTSRHDKVLEWKHTLRTADDLATAVVHIETSPLKRVEDVYDGVHDGPVLGSGAAGIVRKCRHKETGYEFAIKCLNIGLIEIEDIIETLREEIFIMCQADHPDILRLEEVYESDTQIYLIEDLLTGGDMFDRLEEQPDYHYSEIQCAQIVKQMLASIRYLHSKKVVHRDLKLENFLFDDEESNNIRLIDFGLSKHFNPDGQKLTEAAGTPYTIAPEMIKGEYDEKVDVWALGVITYLLLCGDPPFGGMDGEALTDVKQNILDCNLVFEPKEIWDSVSDAAKTFIRRLLTENPNERPSAVEAQKDEWMVVTANKDPESSKPLNTKMVNNLLKFKDYSTLHKILLEVVSFTLNPSQIKEMRREFEKIDRDGRGEITLEDLKYVMINRFTETTGTSSPLTEEEVEVIFNSLRISTKDTTIKWHDFIAAGLSRAEIDNRNLKLAFNRFDADGKGYITLEDIGDLLRKGDQSMDNEVLEMWNEGLEEAKCQDSKKMYFKDFQRMMKGRERQRSSLIHALRTSGSVREFGRRSQFQRGPSNSEMTRSQRMTCYSDRVSSSRVLTEAMALSGRMSKADNANGSSSSLKSGRENQGSIVSSSRRLGRPSATLVFSSSSTSLGSVNRMGSSRRLGSDLGTVLEKEDSGN